MRNISLLRTALLEDLKICDDKLLSDMSKQAAARLWLSKSFFKKFLENSREADTKCLSLFLMNNERCRDFSLRPLTSMEDLVIGQVKMAFDNIFHCGPDLTFGFPQLFEGFRTGPGASVGAVSNNFYTKLFDSNLTCTSDALYALYRRAICCYPTWYSAEEARFSAHGTKIVTGSSLSFVPKTSDISRSICTEPNLNMLFQMSIGAFLTKQLKRRFSIDLSIQPDRNRELARLGSIDGSFGTIDLSSASDSISLSLLREILPPYFFRWLTSTRSGFTTLPSGETRELYMVSSMGNAFTFPLQTLLFSILVCSCYQILGIKPESETNGPKNWAVFGDDIIVRKDAYDFVIRCLELFGFKVNDEKSFNTGDFRESCGSDFYRGHDIRGVYVRQLDTRADVYSAINRLMRWIVREGYPLPKTLSVLNSRFLISKKILRVPTSAGDAEGLKVPLSLSPDHFDIPTQSKVYYALEKVTKVIQLPYDATEVRYYPRRVGSTSPVKVMYNPDGLAVALLAGFIRNGRVGVRLTQDTFKVRRRVTSSWGSTVTAGSDSRECVWEDSLAIFFSTDTNKVSAN